MSKNLYHVSDQWRKRRAHERFYDVKDVLPLLETEHRYERSMLVPMDAIAVSADPADDGGLYLSYPGVTKPVALNHWSFQGLCNQLEMSTHDIRDFPARLVAPMVQYRLEHAAGIGKHTEDVDSNPDPVDDEMVALYGDATLANAKPDSQSRQVNILVAPNHETKELYAKSVTSSQYGRYNNLQLAKDAMLAVEHGWRTPRAMAVSNNPFPDGHIQGNRIATVDDEMACSLIKAGMQIGPAGVYLGDRNMFIFLASDKVILPGHFRFVTLENSEVGESRTLKATFGLMNYVCMNHILWGVSNVHSVVKKHRRGSVGEFHGEFAESLELVSKSEGVPMALYQLAKSTEIASNKEGVVKALYGRRKALLSQKVIERAFDCAEANPGDADGAPPTSYWGFAQGLTRYSQAVKYADTRQDLDRAAGELLDELQPEDASKSVSVPATIESDMVVSVSNDTSTKRSRKSSK